MITHFLGERYSYLNSFDWASVRKMVNALIEEIQSGPADAFMRVAAGICMTYTPRIRH